jgi:hypothetical protein
MQNICRVSTVVIFCYLQHVMDTGNANYIRPVRASKIDTLPESIHSLPEKLNYPKLIKYLLHLVVPKEKAFSQKGKKKHLVVWGPKVKH